MCNAGYLGANSGTCTARPGGMYRPASDGQICKKCPEFLDSREGSTMLANCVCDIQDPIPDAVACTVRACAPGLTGPSPEQCILCVAGKCKNSTGSAECTNCTTGKYSSVVGAVSDVCQSCSITAYSPEGSSSQDACVCGVGVSQKIYALPTITCTGGCLCPGAPQQSNGEIRSQPGRLNKYTFPTKYKK